MREEFINKANSIPTPSHLDDHLYDGQFLTIVGANVEPSYEHIDLPVRQVIGLNKPDDYIEHKTWRKAVKGLKCDDWTELKTEIREYFEGDVGNIGFPTLSSKGVLRINFVGGAGYCGIGNNRLVAAKIHLTHKFGELAYLKNAWCNYKPIHPKLAKELSLAVKNKADVYYSLDNPGLTANHADPGSFKGVIQIDNGNDKIEFYLVFSNTICKIANQDSLLKILLNRRVFKPCQRINYTRVSHKLLKKMFDLSKVSHWFSIK